MPTKLVALRVPQATLAAVNAIAAAQQWTQSRAIVILLESALQAQHPIDARFRPSTSGDSALPACADDHVGQPVCAEQSKQ
jgi:hypothetical protein